jgi:cytochrome P450
VAAAVKDGGMDGGPEQAGPELDYTRLLAEASPRRMVTPDGRATWFVAQYDHVRTVLADPRCSRDFRKIGLGAGRPGPAAPPAPASGPGPPDDASIFGSTMLSADPPDHTRLRSLVSAAFTAQRIEGLRPHVERFARDLLGELPTSGRADLVGDFALPLTVMVICELLGVPFDDRETFRRSSDVLVRADSYPEAAVSAARRSQITYLRGLIGRKRAAPDAGLVSLLVATRDERDSLDDHELLAMCSLLLVAGHETTASLVGNGMLRLLREPHLMAALRAAPATIPRAVEELLRLDGPVPTALPRHVTEAVEVGGATLEVGDLVIPVLAAANRDPRRFAGPDRFDPGRAPNPHVAFGHGAHHCLGSSLARLEGEVAFGVLLSGSHRLELAVPPESVHWRRGVVRGPVELPVVLVPN